jgi:hypothetical protein
MAFLLIDGYNLIGTAHTRHKRAMILPLFLTAGRMVRQGKQDYEQAILQLSIQELLKMLIQLSKES